MTKIKLQNDIIVTPKLNLIANVKLFLKNVSLNVIIGFY